MRSNECKIQHSRFTMFVIVLVLILVWASIIPISLAVSLDSNLFPLESKPYGLTYSQWNVKWWQWFITIPQQDSPMNDQTGKNCRINQNDANVWFLTGSAGGFAERTCITPSGRAILFPLATNECSKAEFPSLKTETELHDCAMGGNKVSSMELTLDGVTLQKSDLEKYRVQSSLFNVTLPENNVYGASAGPTQAVSDGYWIFLKPLSLGSHALRFKQTTLENPTTGTRSYGYDVIYHLIVK
jgi:hypothetical protein